MARLRMSRFDRLVKHGYDPCIIMGTNRCMLRKKSYFNKTFKSVRAAHFYVFGY